ncbi:1010_t:CDS:1, partial [Gigaspora rosea]
CKNGSLFFDDYVAHRPETRKKGLRIPYLYPNPFAHVKPVLYNTSPIVCNKLMASIQDVNREYLLEYVLVYKDQILMFYLVLPGRNGESGMKAVYLVESLNKGTFMIQI